MIQFYYGTDEYKVNITDIINKKCINNNYIEINNNYNDLFNDIKPNENKIIYIDLPNIKNITVCEDTPLKINLKPKKFDNINIVYFINTLINKNYYYLMKSQLEELKETKLLDISTLYIEATVINDNIKKEILDIIPNAIITLHIKDWTEYYGIYKIWQLSHENPDSINLYFHSKGISRIQNITENNCRTSLEQYIFKNVINNWKDNILILRYFESINKLGICNDKLGIIWYNYWWVRGSYVIQLEEPLKTMNRYYYERWLSTVLKNNIHMYKRSDDLESDMSNYDYDYNDCFTLDVNELSCEKIKANIGSCYYPY